MLLAQILPFTLTGFLFALVGTFNRLRRGSRDILALQIMALVWGFSSAIIISRLLIELAYKAHLWM
jgi:hypothetical protein